MRAALVQGALALALVAGASPAHALFGDDEARKAILDLRGRVQEHQDTTEQRLAKIEAQLADMFSKLSRPQAELVQKVWDAVDQLWPEIVKLEEDLNGIAPPRVVRMADWSLRSRVRSGDSWSSSSTASGACLALR